MKTKRLTLDDPIVLDLTQKYANYPDEGERDVPFMIRYLNLQAAEILLTRPDFNFNWECTHVCFGDDDQCLMMHWYVGDCEDPDYGNLNDWLVYSYGEDEFDEGKFIDWADSFHAFLRGEES